ncbi:MAG: diguanylate cyclase [Pseudomonadota bacterium]
MNDSTTLEESGQFLRMALPLMAEQKVPVTPLNYAVWYHHVAGINPQLSERLEAMLAKGDKFDAQAMAELHKSFLEQENEARVRDAEETVQRILAGINSSLDSADSEISEYEKSLTQGAEALSDDAVDIQTVVKSLLNATSKMTESHSALHLQIEESQKETERLQDELNRVRHEAKHDPLTGLANRKAFDEAVAELQARPDYVEKEHCVLIGDIDKFKNVNDTYGHLFGDKVLKVVGKAFQKLIKGQDMVARFGGEEFTVLLPDTPLTGGVSVAESIRSAIEKGRVFNPKTGKEVEKITISIGATLIQTGESIDEALERADEALYLAKSSGRNRVEVGQPRQLARSA